MGQTARLHVSAVLTLKHINHKKDEQALSQTNQHDAECTLKDDTVFHSVRYDQFTWRCIP